MEPTHYLLAIFFVALLILVIQKVIPKPITKDTHVNGKMTIGGIMKEFRQLTSTHFEYKKIAESQVYKDFELDEACPKARILLGKLHTKKIC